MDSRTLERYITGNKMIARSTLTRQIAEKHDQWLPHEPNDSPGKRNFRVADFLAARPMTVTKLASASSAGKACKS
jgi:hypothetical protein